MTVNKEKLNEVGTKLNVNSSDIEIRKGLKTIKKMLYPLIIFFTLFLSAISGVISGIFEKNNTSYPFCANQSNNYLGGNITVSIINIGNGLITIPNKRFRLNIIIKICIFIGIFISSHFIFKMIFSYFDSNLCTTINYNVYKKENRG